MATIDTSWHPVAVPDTGGSAFLSYSSALRDSANKLLENVVSQRQKDRELKQAELRDKLANDLAVAKLEQDAKQNAMTNMLKAIEIDNNVQYNAERIKSLQEANDLKRELFLARLNGARGGTGGTRGGTGGTGNGNFAKVLQSLSDWARLQKAKGQLKLDDKNNPLKNEVMSGISWLFNHPDKKIYGVPAYQMLTAYNGMGLNVLPYLNGMPVSTTDLLVSEEGWGERLYSRLIKFAEQYPNVYKQWTDANESADKILALESRLYPYLAQTGGNMTPELLDYILSNSNGSATPSATSTTNATTTNNNNTNNVQKGNGADILSGKN